MVALIPAFGMAQIKGKWEPIIPNVPPKVHSLDQVRIYEVFSFGCPHCYHLNEKLPQLKKRFGNKIKLIPMPIGWQGVNPGRLYFIAEEKGKGEAVKAMIFDFYHQKGLEDAIYSKDKLQYVARFNGLSNEFKTRMEAPDIVKKMNDSMQFARDKGVQSTPTLIIEGALKTHGDIQNLTLIINSLLKDPVK